MESRVKHRSFNPKFLFINKYARSQVHWREFVATEAFAGAEFACANEAIAVKLRNDNNEINGVFVQKV
jgi:hypothetical protein